LDIGGASFAPVETDAPLVVDADRILTPPLALQRLQAISRRRAQIAQCVRLIDQAQLPQRDRLDVGRQLAASSA
jgi:hypothetical protein